MFEIKANKTLEGALLYRRSEFKKIPGSKGSNYQKVGDYSKKHYRKYGIYTNVIIVCLV